MNRAPARRWSLLSGDTSMFRTVRAVAAAGIVAALSTASLAQTAAAAPIPYGLSEQTVPMGSVQMTVYTYRPNCQNPSLVLVFHGVNRKPESSRKAAMPLADQMCLIVVAPLFDKETFPTWAYQRGGIVNRGRVQNRNAWSGNFALGLVAWAQQEEGRPMAYYLMGHSAGGQFLSRIAAFTPTQARRIIIANPSTHVFASAQTAAPFGFGGVYSPGDTEAQLRIYLAQPITIVLGQDDNGDENLNESPEGKQQGRTRYERGLNAYWTARRLAEARGWAFNWQLVVLPGVGHSARSVYGSPQVAQAFAPPQQPARVQQQR
jgi:pimeloyl-ACP methyl ester carboxylesterase